MHSELYLDTARLGRMSPGARSAEQDFCWLASQLGSSLYLERFLSNGFQALPARISSRLDGLRCWTGMSGFRRKFSAFVRQPRGLPAYFFGQSSASIRFVAQCLFSQSQAVLATDLVWPPYLNVLKQSAAAAGATLHVVPLSQVVHGDGGTDSDVLDAILSAFVEHQCDGLFVSDITNLGVRLPVQRLSCNIRSHRPESFIAIDGAQALHQRPIDLARLRCDLYMTGTQKWFGSYHPLRVVFAGSENSKHIVTSVAEHLAASNMADGLFSFCRELEGDNPSSCGETINVSALIAAAGALADATRDSAANQNSWVALRRNASALSDWLRGSRWRVTTIHDSLASGIVVARSRDATTARRLKEMLLLRGLIASPFRDGSVRLSMPRFNMPIRQQTTIRRALDACGRSADQPHSEDMLSDPTAARARTGKMKRSPI
jgi:hypothetical protein